MLYYQYIITAALAIILVNFLINSILFNNIKRFSIPDDVLKSPPLISVLIPARNEEENIRRCLTSLSKQDYPDFEILVLDDNSTDNTEKVVQEMVKKDNRIRLITGKPLKAGWLGKCWACQQLAEHAKGQYFVFTDADTLHFNDTISKAFAALKNNNLDAISVFPNQIAVTFHERMTVPFIYFAILSFMPLFLVKRIKSSFFSTGIGQFFLFSRHAYEKMGGHEAVKAEILEDIHISKQIKKAGFKYMIFDGRANVYHRFYRNFKEVMSGFSKFIYPAFDYNIFVEALAMLMFSIVFLFPFILIPIGIFILDWSGLVLTLGIVQIFLIFIIKIILAIRFKNRILDIIFTPISICYILVIAANSYRQAKFGEGIYWKGRTYNINTEDHEEIDLVKDN
jgi:chlorobactene glucosyltransferase